MCRYFDISAAKADLKYAPLITFKDGWAQTIAWFKEHWLPAHQLSANKAVSASRKKKAE